MSEMLVSEIIVADRYRQDLGDVAALAESIKSLGLLQPVGVTKDNRLVFGERRLQAVKLLGWEKIPARVIEIERIVDGEYAENEMRKDFTPSERVAITNSLKGFEHGGDRRSDQAGNIPLDTATAAKKAGLGNEWTYRQARKVVEQAAQEIIHKMDSGELSISAAAVIAEEPQDEQKRIAELPTQERKATVAALRKKDLPTPDEARRIAKETGMATLDKNFEYQSGGDERAQAIALAATGLVMACEEILSCFDEALSVQATPGEITAQLLKYGNMGPIRAAADKLKGIAVGT